MQPQVSAGQQNDGVVPVYNDKAPENAALPYIVRVFEYIEPPIGLDPLEDGLWVVDKGEFHDNNGVTTFYCDNGDSDDCLRNRAAAALLLP